MYQFSTMELSIIRNMMLSKTNKEIAQTLDLPVDIIQRAVQGIEQDTGLTSKTAVIERSKFQKVAKKIISKPVKQTPVIDNLAYREEKKRREDKSRFVTRLVDLNKMQSVRIDDRTTIFINPGESQLDARMKYHDREKLKKLNFSKK